MRTLFTGLTVLVLLGSASADEIILKSGKKITWTSIKDLGDTYEITTKTGSTTAIKKADVVSITTVDPGAPLTGATFSFPKGTKFSRIDLMRSVDLKRDIIFGEWKRAGSGMQGGTKDAIDWGRFQTGYEVQKTDYDLTVVVQRTEGTGGFYAGLVTNGKQSLILFDGMSGWSGLFQLGGKGPETNGTGVREQVFKPGKRRIIVFKVRSTGVYVEIDRKPFITWQGDWSQTNFHANLERFQVSNKNVIYFGCGPRTSFKVLQAVLSEPK
jgi:hypothetical protein